MGEAVRCSRCCLVRNRLGRLFALHGGWPRGCSPGSGISGSPLSMELSSPSYSNQGAQSLSTRVNEVLRGRKARQKQVNCTHEHIIQETLL